MTIYSGGPEDSVVYTLTAPDGSVAVFNDSTHANYVGMARWTGLDSAEIRESIEDHAGHHGAIQGANFRGRRPIVGTIEIVASSTADRNAKSTLLRRAANCLDTDGTLAFTPTGGIASQVSVRLNQPLRRSDEPGWKQTWQLALVAADPYIQSATEHSQAGTTAAVTITNQGDGPAAATISAVVTATADVNFANQTTGETVNVTDFNPATYAAAIYAAQWGSVGAYDVSVDSAGNIFVCSFSSSCVRKYNSSGVYQSTIGGPGTTNGYFLFPRGVAHDASDNLYVADTWNHRVQKFNSSGTWQANFGSYGATDGLLNAPWGVTVDSGNNVFVADAGNYRVQKFNSSAVFQAKVGSSGTGNGSFGTPLGPCGIDCDSSDLILVCDPSNSRVQKFTNALVYSAQFGTEGVGTGQFADDGPLGITIGASDVRYVTDSVLNRIQKFDSSNAYVGTFGSSGSGDGNFSQPQGLATNAANTSLVVADYLNARVEQFTLGTSATLVADFKNAALTSGGANAYGFVDVPVSVWWELAPGDNTVFVSGSTSWTVEWRDSWL